MIAQTAKSLEITPLPTRSSMHALLISQCESKAILRTARVLDAYAIRHGDRTWQTTITKEGLSSLYTELRQSATRQTAVSCYVNDAGGGMKLQWTVGRASAFGPGGAVAVATRRSKQRELELTAPLRLSALIAECAGLIHDFGKYGKMFQDKLESSTPMADDVRHEWISLHVLIGLLEGKSWEESWKAPFLEMQKFYEHEHGFKGGLKTVESVLAYLVMTHHRMPRTMPVKTAKNNRLSTIKKTVPGDDAYIRTEAPRVMPDCLAEPPSEILDRINVLLLRIRELSSSCSSAEDMRAISAISRMSMILADHHVSSLEFDPSEDLESEGKESVVYANTRRAKNGDRVKNQPLGWHLKNVGSEAANMVSRLLNFCPPGLSRSAMGNIESRSSGRFSWQNTAADALCAAQKAQSVPTLVFNIASTGSGKTRMNLRAAAALRPSNELGERDPLRVTIAQNLRSLTLQTRDAICNQISIDKSEVACVLGSKIAIKLHEARNQGDRVPDLQPSDALPLEDEDGNDLQEEFEVSEEKLVVDDWLKPFVEKKPLLKSLLFSPAVVSTIDFIINAGEPNRQGHYAMANLRLMHSDLILDEVDAYDPKALLAVARVVCASAMHGRNVIVSSATISPPVARLLFQSFEYGMKLRATLTTPGDSSSTAEDCSAGVWRQAIIDDSISPTIVSCPDADAFGECFDRHIAELVDSMGVLHYRKAELQPVIRSVEGFENAVIKAGRRMHKRHAWVAPENAAGFTGNISFGLVRMANIVPAIKIARSLSDGLDAEDTAVRVCCYHSQVGLAQRWHIEKTLDEILCRKDADWAERAVENPDVLEALQSAVRDGKSNVQIIVVATPVEEIGRDHDFDWGVIEPSSSQSIVQAGGRINRHRLLSVERANIAVLQFNYLSCLKADDDGRNYSDEMAFQRPGLECAETTKMYCSDEFDHDLSCLIDWSLIEKNGQIDARLRYQTEHQISLADNESIRHLTSSSLRSFLAADRAAWLMSDLYEDAPLRESGPQDDYFRFASGKFIKREVSPASAFGFKDLVRNPAKIIVRHENDWLSRSFEEISKIAEHLKISVEDATLVQMRRRDSANYSFDESFGYYQERSHYYD